MLSRYTHNPESREKNGSRHAKITADDKFNPQNVHYKQYQLLKKIKLADPTASSRNPSLIKTLSIFILSGKGAEGRKCRRPTAIT